jgi:hypothetical protein
LRTTFAIRIVKLRTGAFQEQSLVAPRMVSSGSGSQEHTDPGSHLLLGGIILTFCLSIINAFFTEYYVLFERCLTTVLCCFALRLRSTPTLALGISNMIIFQHQKSLGPRPSIFIKNPLLFFSRPNGQPRSRLVRSEHPCFRPGVENFFGGYPLIITYRCPYLFKPACQGVCQALLLDPGKSMLIARPIINEIRGHTGISRFSADVMSNCIRKESACVHLS